MRKWYWCGAICMTLALAGCDEPADGDAGVDASTQDEDGGTLTDSGTTDGGTTEAAPTVTAATPTDIARGATLVLSGTDLGGASAVTIGGTAQTIGENTDDSLTIDAVAAETPTGEQELVVTTAGGSSEPFTLTVLSALSVAGASAVDSVTAVVMFSRELDPATVDPEDFTIDGLTVSAATSSGTTVTLTTTTQSSGAPYEVTVADVADTFGNGIGGAASATFTGFAVAAPTITTISASELVRGFSEVTVTGTNLAAAMVTIGGTAQPKVSNSETEVVVGPIASGTPLETQPLTVTTGGGTSGSMNVDVLEELQITGASSLSTTEVEVTFNRAVDDATVAPARFTISGLTISGANASGDTVTLTTSAQTEGASYTVAVDSMLRDGYGSPATSGTFVFTGFEPPPPTEFIVVRVGDGTAPLSAAAAPVFLERRSISDGSLIDAVPMPATAAGANLPFTLGGTGWTANSDGALSRSEDGTMLALTGYQSVPGTEDPRSDALARVVAVIDAADFGASPAIDTSTTIGTNSSAVFATTSPRGAVIDGTTIWTVGGFGGVWTVQLGTSAATQVVTPATPEPPSSGRAIGIFGGNLFYSSGGGAVPNQLNQVGTGLPTAAETSTTMVFGSSNPYSFTGFDRNPAEPGIDTFYIADATSGLERWEKSGGAWNKTGTFTPGVYQVSCFEDGVDVVCLASRSASLHYLRDIGGTTASTALDTLVAAAATNTEFRGVALPPIP